MSAFGLNLFGDSKPKLSAADQAKNWKRELSKEMRGIDRGVNKLSHAEKGAIKECKKLAKEGQPKAAKLLAREVVNIRKARDRMLTSKAQMNSVVMSLQLSIATIKMQGCLSKSTDVMQAMGALVKLPELQENMLTMAKEMEKAGLVDEIVQESLEMAEPDIDIEADAEVSRIMQEITTNIFTKDADVATGAPVVADKKKAPAAAEAEEVEEGIDEEEMKAIQSRLQML
jgi:charged multivesicular body protein 3